MDRVDVPDKKSRSAESEPHLTTARPDRPANPAGNDAVCFTAGPQAAVIGAGTIHAYLASRRPPPRAAAGISLGAINAAAMQRAYREIARAPADAEETARWTWFRKYLDAMSTEPFQVLWKTIPDLSDFFADMIPIQDASVPRAFRHDETRARRELYLKVKLGRWLALLPINVRLIASAIVNFVRSREKYPRAERAISLVRLLANASWFVFLVTIRICLAPQFFPEHRFRVPSGNVGAARRRFQIPGSGWLNLSTVTLSLLLPVPIIVAILIVSPPESHEAAWLAIWPAAAAVLGVFSLVAATRGFRQWVMGWWIIRRLVLPLLDVAAYIYTLVNITLVIGFLVALATAAVLAILQESSGDVVNIMFGVAVVLWAVTMMFVPAIVLPETRWWLIERGLFEEWPRPLFGWWPYVGLWINLSMLLISSVLGGYFVWSAARHENWTNAAVFIVSALVLLASIPILPLMLLAAPVLLWRRMRRLAAACVGWFKWWAWIMSAAGTVTIFALATTLFAQLLEWFRFLLARHGLDLLADEWALLWHSFVFAVFVLMGTWFVLVALVTQPVLRRGFAEVLLDKVGLWRSLFPDTYLRLALSRLFDERALADEKAPPETVRDEPGYPAAIIVAAPLQTIYKIGKRRCLDQVSARPGAPLVHALRCALAVPPLFAPVCLTSPETPSTENPDQQAWWLRDHTLNDPRNVAARRRGIDLVDGSIIRQNPLPALFAYLRETPEVARQLAEHNDSDHPAIHVVYGVPTGGRVIGEGDPAASVKNTIVDVGQESLRLSQRRDTQLEVNQTNVIATIEELAPPEGNDSLTAALFADEIAPETDVRFDNGLSPSRHEVLDGVAAGCRRTLERLYRYELAADSRCASNGCVKCCDFFHVRRGADGNAATAGLPEICRRCPGDLRTETAQTTEATVSALKTLLDKPEPLADIHPQLNRSRPRVVFVASGGVFRGAFHIGMLAALKAADIKPDLIVGASVGTLMGAALGTMFARPDSRTLEKLVNVFLHVDEHVALTLTLKNAVREVGLRGRSIRLSPRQVRRMVQRGARGDPGFAATGAPAALVDAMSDLFLIPHRKTQRIVASFIAGDVTGAVKRLLTALRTETIRRLDVERAVFGSSLLEHVAADLLADVQNPSFLLNRQPFQHADMAFYATTTNLNTHSAMLLGGNVMHPDAPYDFIEAALASSAFPAVFEPRKESRVFPGAGSADVLLADGGMFDNLPFDPAIRILSRTQLGGLDQSLTALERLRQRIDQPDLIIVGALDPNPEKQSETSRSFKSIEAVRHRAESLNHNVKIRSFELAAQRIDGQLQRIEAGKPRWLSTTTQTPVDRFVNAGVLPVFPASRDHLNGTFSFCASTGLTTDRVRKSIADGCFQTFLEISCQQVEGAQARAAHRHRDSEMLTARSATALKRAIRAEWDSVGADMCPYFVMDGQRFTCPFAGLDSQTKRDRKLMQGVFIACQADTTHRISARDARRMQEGQPVTG